ncbi:F-box domain containing protein [Tanacetum coccineum]
MCYMSIYSTYIDIPHEASPASIPQRHVAGDTFPQRHVAGESPDMSPGKRAIVVVMVKGLLESRMEIYLDFNALSRFSTKGFVWAHNKLKVAPATQPRALSIVQGRAVGVTLKNFSKYVTLRHDNQVQLSSANLSFHRKATQLVIRKILNHLFSHNLEQLSVVSFQNKIPVHLFSSQSLKHLMLTQKFSCAHCTLTSTWDLPSLTTLYLEGITLTEVSDGDFLTNCTNLKNLTLNYCQIRGGVSICLPKLSHLTLEYVRCITVNVIAPQLKNLSIKQYEFSTRISLDAVLSLEKVDLSIIYPRDARGIVSLLGQFRSVKFLTLNLEILELLSSSVELISYQPSPFANLKSLKIYPIRKEVHEKATVSIVVENFFLDSSPSATLTMVLREEIRMYKLMEELQGLLNQWKTNSDKNTGHVDQGEVEDQRAQQETIMESQCGERLAEIKSYWSDFKKWSEEGDKRTCRIISMLQEIESLLIELPASKRAKIQPMCSSLYAEADTLMDNMMDRVRIQFHKKPRVIVSFYQIAAFAVKSELGEIMDSRHDKKRMNVEGDRLSSLPDNLIHKILSFISLQQAIKTSTLSSRWRYIWTSMPYLNFSTQSFSAFNKFSKFATQVLSRHENQVELSSANLSFHGKASQVFITKILNYVFSHNIEQLSVVSFQDKIDIRFPVYLFSPESLKHLMWPQKSSFAHCTLTSTWDSQSLTTLYLDGITLNEVKDGDFFTNCTNLKNLTLKSCQIRGGANFCLPKLSSLTLEHVYCIMVNVIAPQLKNLIIENYDVSTFISLDGVLSLEKVDLSISHPRDACRIVSLLGQLCSVKYLTLNLEIVELLSSRVELVSHQPSPFANLKSLKMYPVCRISQGEVNVSTVVENYFLGSSPSVTLTMVLREEITAHKLIKELQGLLKQWIANNDNNTSHSDQGEVENQRAQQETIMESHFGERLTQIKSYWGELYKWYEEGDRRTCRIISLLQLIESFLKMLPASHRAKMQPMYTSLYAEADTFMDNMMDRMRILCDKKPRR